MIDTTLTLICNPAAPGPVGAVAPGIAALLQDAAPGPIERRDLGAGVAEDFHFRIDATAWPTIAERARALIGARPVDFALQRREGRRKRLLIADMDSTIIEQECIDELAAFVGKRDEISAITERAMRGELDFDGALKARVSMLAGLGGEKLDEAFRKRITLTPGARTLVQTMRRHGAFTALVSGGFSFFTERVAAATGFEAHQANTLQMADGALTGAVKEPILGRAAKKAALQRYAAGAGVALNETLAVGDGANDLDMLSAAGLGVAFRAKPAVAAEADVRIDHADLTALLYLQGIAQTDFVTT